VVEGGAVAVVVAVEVVVVVVVGAVVLGLWSLHADEKHVSLV